MGLYDILTILITLSALFSYLNFRYIRLPTTVGLMFFALILSLALIVAGQLGWGIQETAQDLIGRIDFNRLLLHGMLGFLLFAGALHVNLDDLLERKWTIASLATVGVVISTIVVGGFSWVLFKIMHLHIPFIYCLLFGALISPTDPISVLGILKTLGAPRTLEATFAGESLFNDGIGVVVFIVLLELATEAQHVSAGAVGLLFLAEAGGGILLGLGIGLLAYMMLKAVDIYQVEVLITLALVMGGYSFANTLHTSGPLAMVAAGLLIGNHGRALAMSEVTRKHLDTFWELVDEVFNAVLFVLIGLEILTLSMAVDYLIAGVVAIPMVLTARLISVSIPITILRRRRRFVPNVVKILTWGGLRGGISVALALSLPAGPPREVILTMTYIVVVFSVLAQGVSIRPFVLKALSGGPNR